VYPRLRFVANHVSNANPTLLSKNSRRCRPVEPIRPQRFSFDSVVIKWTSWCAAKAAIKHHAAARRVE
jgi:hypothetical protein